MTWLDLPPRQLHKNWRGWGFVRSLHVRKYRQHAKERAALILDQGPRNPLWHEATVQATFYFADSRKRDPGALSALLEPAWDGFQDAGLLVDDDKLTHLPIEQRKDPDGPGVRIEVWR